MLLNLFNFIREKSTNLHTYYSTYLLRNTWIPMNEWTQEDNSSRYASIINILQELNRALNWQETDYITQNPDPFGGWAGIPRLFIRQACSSRRLAATVFSCLLKLHKRSAAALARGQILECTLFLKIDSG